MGKIVVIRTLLSSPQVKSYHPQEAFLGSCQLALIIPLLIVPHTASMSASKAEPMSDFSLHVQGLALDRFLQIKIQVQL